jgi:hypothetical protein
MSAASLASGTARDRGFSISKVSAPPSACSSAACKTKRMSRNVLLQGFQGGLMTYHEQLLAPLAVLLYRMESVVCCCQA